MNWLLLLHQIPPQPAYFRAKVLRRLNQVGALAIKNSAYVLPASDEALEDLQWVRREISDQGGEAWLFKTDVAGGLSDDAIQNSFRRMRAPDYTALSAGARDLLAAVKSNTDNINYEAEWRKLRRRLDDIRRIDFFQAPG